MQKVIKMSTAQKRTQVEYYLLPALQQRPYLQRVSPPTAPSGSALYPLYPSSPAQSSTTDSSSASFTFGFVVENPSRRTKRWGLGLASSGPAGSGNCDFLSPLQACVWVPRPALCLQHPTTPLPGVSHCLLGRLLGWPS